MKAVKINGRYYIVRTKNTTHKGGFKGWWLVKYGRRGERGEVFFSTYCSMPKELVGQRVRIVIEPINEVADTPQNEWETDELIDEVEKKYKKYKTRYTHLVKLIKENEIKLGKPKIRGGRIEQRTNRRNGSKDEQDE